MFGGGGVQGTEDEVIHISCGKKLYDLTKNKYPPLWAQVRPPAHLMLAAWPDVLCVPRRRKFNSSAGPSRSNVKQHCSTAASHAGLPRSVSSGTWTLDL